MISPYWALIRLQKLDLLQRSTKRYIGWWCEWNWITSFLLALSHKKIFPSVCRFSTQHLHMGGFSYIWSFVWYFRCTDKTERTYSVHSYYMIRSMLCLGLWAWAGIKWVIQRCRLGAQQAASPQSSASTSCISFLELQHICPDCHHWKSKLLELMFSCYSVPK